MIDWGMVALMTIGELLVVIFVFAVLVYVGRFAADKLNASEGVRSFKLFNPQEYIPEERLTTLKQVFYLIMILLFVINIMNLLIYYNTDIFFMTCFDTLVSLYLAVHFRNESLNKLVLFSLVPFGSLGFLIFDGTFVFLLDIVHVFGFLYFIRRYYHKFIEYTESNRLGITILLLFLIIFVSFLLTMVVENVSPLNSILMVSNAFTSNGYSILGDSSIGKFNAIFLVWSGFILSGVGTATLTVALVMKSVNNSFDKLEESVKKNKKS